MQVKFTPHAATRFSQRVCRIKADATIDLVKIGFKRSKLKATSAVGECEYWFNPNEREPLVLVVARTTPVIVTVLNEMRGVVPAVYAAA